MTTETCPRCGSPLLPFEQLAELARAVAGGAARTVAGWRAMRLAVPQALVHAMNDLERDAPRLASALACRASACVEGGLPAAVLARLQRGPPAILADLAAELRQPVPLVYGALRALSRQGLATCAPAGRPPVTTWSTS